MPRKAPSDSQCCTHNEIRAKETHKVRHSTLRCQPLPTINKILFRFSRASEVGFSVVSFGNTQ